MKLELGRIWIKDICFADTSKVEDGILYVDKKAIEEIALAEEKIAKVEVDIAKPGESVRITPVKDVIEPRVKVEGRGGIFPGVVSKVDCVGEGKTYALKGMAVVTAGPIVGFQEGIIDMSGVGADYTPFSKLLNLVVVCSPVEDVKPHDYEQAVRMIGLKVANYLGELARELTPDETQVYETKNLKESFSSTQICQEWPMYKCYKAKVFCTIPMSMEWMQRRLFQPLFILQKLWMEQFYQEIVCLLVIRIQPMFTRTIQLLKNFMLCMERSLTLLDKLLQMRMSILPIRSARPI